MKITILGAGPGGYEAALDAAKCGHGIAVLRICPDKIGA